MWCNYYGPSIGDAGSPSIAALPFTVGYGFSEALAGSDGRKGRLTTRKRAVLQFGIFGRVIPSGGYGAEHVIRDKIRCNMLARCVQL
jgi:hypothetical protein